MLVSVCDGWLRSRKSAKLLLLAPRFFSKPCGVGPVVGQFEIGSLGRSLRRPRFLVFWGIAKPLPQAPFATSNQIGPLPSNRQKRHKWRQKTKPGPVLAGWRFPRGRALKEIKS